MHESANLVAKQGLDAQSEAGGISSGDTARYGKGSRRLLPDASARFIRRDEFYAVAFCIPGKAR
jgi:hypothetical protein